ncbi:hypothetical protein PTKU46_80780 [Paraburkholderia terrae]
MIGRHFTIAYLAFIFVAVGGVVVGGVVTAFHMQIAPPYNVGAAIGALVCVALVDATLRIA